MEVEAHFHFFSFFLFRIVIIPFSQRRWKVVCKAKRPKYFSSLHGRIKYDLWACHSGLSGAQNKQIARKLIPCLHSSEAEDFGCCFCVENHLLWKSKEIVYFSFAAKPPLTLTKYCFNLVLHLHP